MKNENFSCTEEAYLGKHPPSRAYLLGEIEEPNLELIALFNGMTESDSVILEINSVGGCCMSAIQICDAIRRCAGLVVAKVVGEASSAAAIIALTCDALIVAPYSMLMFHSFSTIQQGKQHELMSGLLANTTIITAWYEDTCKPFLSATELRSIVEGKDIYIAYNDKLLTKRIKRHFNIQVS